MEKKDRLRSAIDYLIAKDIVRNQVDVAAKLRCNKTTISNALKGDQSYLTGRFIGRFCRAFPQISQVWLDKGDGSMLTNTENTNNSVKMDNPTIKDSIIGGNSNVVNHHDASSEHDELVRSQELIANMRRAIETIADPNEAISVIGFILGVNRNPSK